MKGNEGSFKKWYVFYGCAFIIPVICLVGICAYMGITPFGRESFLIADMQKQYVDYLSYYKTIFRGENDIFYTFGKCLGGDMIGFFSYYLMSPFNLFLLPVRNEWLPAGITVLIVCKAGFCGSTMAYYLKNRFRTESSAEIFLFSTSYAMMGYLCVNSFNIMWQDGLILFPCVLMGIEKLLSGKKPYLYIASLFGVLFTNYYIGYMICIFCVIYLLYRLLVQGKKEELWKKLWRFFYGSLLAGGLCGILLIPTFFTLNGSLKDGKDLGAGITLPNLRPVRVLSKAFTMAYSENELMNGMPTIFCGILMIVLVILFFLNKKIPLKERILSCALLGVIMASFCIARVDFVWHAFMEPSGYHYRYSFIYSFFMIAFSWQGFLQLKEGLDGKRFLLAGGIFLALLFFIFRHPYEYISVKKALPDMVLFFGMLVVLFVLRKGKNYRIWLICLGIVQIGNLSLNSAFTYLKNRNTSYCTASEYREEVQKIGSVVERIKEQDMGVYRLENLEKRNNNDSMHFSYGGLTHYSSNEKNFVLEFLEKMGLNYNQLYVEYGNGSTHTADSLLGVKYLIGKEEIPKTYPEVFTEHGLRVYQNPYSLPIAFLAQTQIRTVDMSEVNPFKLQNAMYGIAAGSEEEIFKAAVMERATVENGTEEKLDKFTIYHREDEPQPIRVNYELETITEGPVYAYVTAGNQAQNAEIYVNGEFLCGYLNRSNWKILYLGEYRKGEHITFTVQMDGDTLMLEEAYFATEDMGTLKKCQELIMGEPVTIEKISSSRLRMNVSNEKEKLLVFSIPYEEDWKIVEDGKKRTGEKVYDTFLAVELEPGNHQIELQYIPRGIKAGSGCTILCAVVLTAMFVCEKTRKKEKKDEECSTDRCSCG